MGKQSKKADHGPRAKAIAKTARKAFGASTGGVVRYGDEADGCDI